MRKLNIAFICTGNILRSQVCETFIRNWGKDIVWNVASAGSYPYTAVEHSYYFNKARDVLRYKYWIDPGNQHSKHIRSLYGHFDLVVYFDDTGIKHRYNDSSHSELWDVARLISPEETVEHCKNGCLDLLHRLRSGWYQ
jgi:protein-tyrosine-phosphatase